MRGLVAVVLVAGAVAQAGPPGKPPHGATRVAIDYTYTSFHHVERHYVLDWKAGTGYVVDKRVVDAALVDALYAALTDLREVDQSLRCLSHYDDYPEYDIAVEGAEPVAIASRSNCHDNVPWNIRRGGKQLAQFTAAESRAVRALLVAIDPDHWRTGDGPDATTGMGGEYIALGDTTHGNKAAQACADSFEASPRARSMVGGEPHVTDLRLSCELSTSPDCTATTATVQLAWSDLDAQLDMPCAKGAVELPAELDDLRDLVASKPVRTLVRVAGHNRVRLWERHGLWNIQTDGDLPALEYERGRTIRAKSLDQHGPSGDPFWKELGFDAKRLTHPFHDAYETSATLDFSGAVVK
ncbi:MAG TPA: hypothetical protein VMJ10_12825 [Kofleriaceae bacterium]|nr:hypothetical protein [Kofleriaceae bacterium]